MSLQQEAEAALINESVYINAAKKQVEACIAYINDPEKRLTENRNVAVKELLQQQ